jgi:molybdenum cofactor cytidylyltransferase
MTDGPAFDLILLAAGEASRMGHRPKALLERDGQSLLLRQVLAARAAGAHQAVVVLGHHAEALAPVLRSLDWTGLTVVHNPDAAAGQGQSLWVGLQSLPPHGLLQLPVMVSLADLPLLGPDSLLNLCQAYAQRPAGTGFVQPFNGARVGNPVMLSPDVADEWRQPQAQGPVLGKTWQQANPERVHRWTTTAPDYFWDLDTPQDVSALAQQHGVHLQWPANLDEPSP